MTDTILIADDEADIVSMLERFFRRKGYNILTASNGNETLKQAGQNPDVMLLDIGMPEPDGLEVCRRIRDHVSCPIIFLTARVEDADKVKGFAAGGDDYVVKPFSLAELDARVSAHLRREKRHSFESQVRFSGDLTIDYAERCLFYVTENCCNRSERPTRICKQILASQGAGPDFFYKEEKIALAKKEFDIVELLSQNPGQIFDKERIYEKIWGYDSEGDSSVVAEHIRRVRAKIALYTQRTYIDTVWGCGYKWTK